MISTPKRRRRNVARFKRAGRGVHQAGRYKAGVDRDAPSRREYQPDKKRGTFCYLPFEYGKRFPEADFHYSGADTLLTTDTTWQVLQRINTPELDAGVVDLVQLVVSQPAAAADVEIDVLVDGVTVVGKWTVTQAWTDAQRYIRRGVLVSSFDRLRGTNMIEMRARRLGVDPLTYEYVVEVHGRYWPRHRRDAA